MEVIRTFLASDSAAQALVVIFLIMSIGIPLGNIKIKGVSLGATFTFLIGILVGHFGIRINPSISAFVTNFGLCLYLYGVGLRAGPGFFNSFKKGGLELNILSAVNVILAAVISLAIAPLFGISVFDIVGINAGATTTTAALAAELQLMEQAGLDASTPPLGTALAYPMGIIALLMVVAALKAFSPKAKSTAISQAEDIFMGTFRVTNRELVGQTLAQVGKNADFKFVASRLWRDGGVNIPEGETVFAEGDRVLVITPQENVDKLESLFGQKENQNWNDGSVNWDKIDANLSATKLIVTNKKINGKTIEALQPRRKYGVNISRVKRAGTMLMATPSLMLRTGDTLYVVGDDAAIKEMGKEYGNSVSALDAPNMVLIGLGMLLGLVLGLLPLKVPGMSTPLSLGLSGGCLFAGILIAAFGPRIHVEAYVSESANQMMGSLGITMFMACLGLGAGPKFFEVVCSMQGLNWFIAGIIITAVPTFITGLLSMKVFKQSWATVVGMLAGSNNTPAVSTMAAMAQSPKVETIFAQTYPLALFLRVLAAQIMVMMAL